MTNKRLVIEDFEEVFSKSATVFGNSSHIIIPQKYKNRYVTVIIEKLNKSNNKKVLNKKLKERIS